MTTQARAAALKQQLQSGEMALGCFLSLGSPLVSELMGNAGYDWALVDLEHGAGGESEALLQLQALSATPAAGIVRVESHARQRAHRILDLGAHGIMFPRVDTEADALAAAAAMRYPPAGVRGVAFSNRACAFGSNFRPYLEASHEALLTVVQIETATAVRNVESIAAAPGVDVLFIGPSDLSHSLGILGQFDHPDFRAAIGATATAAQRHGRMLGILLPQPSDLERYYDLGFRFIASGSDAVLLNNAARALTNSLRENARQKATERAQSCSNQPAH
jgi:4-hydroxy-2-oxoheptanedioate aldolase